MSEPEPLTLALAPLDERPVNTRYPQMVGAIAGVTVLLPPAELLPQGRVPGNASGIGDWLQQSAESGKAQAVLASIELLAHGGLIASRTTTETAAEVLPRLKPLESLCQQGTPVGAFSLITRVSNANDAVEEPLYWKEWGTKFYRYSTLLHKREAGALETGDADALQTLEAVLPPELVSDWLQRRLRNHTVNLTLLDLLARQRLNFLLITSDDTSVYGLPSREKNRLEDWMRLLGPQIEKRVLMHPGADEVGTVLVARFICHQRGVVPRILPVYALPKGEEIVAPYEDRPVRLTVEGQIRACGGEVAQSEAEADIILGVLTPSPRRTEFRPDFARAERVDREPAYRALFARLGAWQKAGRPVALGDVAYPNGADPLALHVMQAEDSSFAPSRLAAYGAWNTAGNTLGVVVAQAICSLFTEGRPEREAAQRLFLAHRFLEDWGYQAVVRRAAREKNRVTWGRPDPEPSDTAHLDITRANIESGLEDVLNGLKLQGIGAGLMLKPGSIRLPWNRTFEADFDLIPES